ncbi:MAG: GGDEF domain-containing protein [Humidesulfovibrio sp.]|nr:GGDEF domain-containing protein [Humidesulfovibrio sp.]
MPKRNPPKPDISPLLEEIRSIETSAQEEPMHDAESLCVLRVVPGLDGPAWASLSASHGLEHWCAVPLGQSAPQADILAQAIGQIAAAPSEPLLHDVLRTEIERSRACNVPLALALIQPDGPRSAVKRLGALLDLVLGLKRCFDHASMLGGDQLAIVFSGASLTEAERFVGAILRRIRANGVDKSAPAAEGLLCSAGLAGYGGCVELTPDELINSAGLALQDARNLGGNRLEVAAPVDVCLASRDTLVHANEKHFLFTGKKAGDK